MPNGRVINEELEFKQRIATMRDRELLEFAVDKLYDLSLRCPEEDGRITALEKQNKKMFGITGGISGVIGAGIIAAINFFTGTK